MGRNAISPPSQPGLRSARRNQTRASPLIRSPRAPASDCRSSRNRAWSTFRTMFAERSSDETAVLTLPAHQLQRLRSSSVQSARKSRANAGSTRPCQPAPPPSPFRHSGSDCPSPPRAVATPAWLLEASSGSAPCASCCRSGAGRPWPHRPTATYADRPLCSPPLTLGPLRSAISTAEADRLGGRCTAARSGGAYAGRPAVIERDCPGLFVGLTRRRGGCRALISGAWSDRSRCAAETGLEFDRR